MRGGRLVLSCGANDTFSIRSELDEPRLDFMGQYCFRKHSSKVSNVQWSLSSQSAFFLLLVCLLLQSSQVGALRLFHNFCVKHCDGTSAAEILRWKGAGGS